MKWIASFVFAFTLLFPAAAHSEAGFAVVHDGDGHSNIRKSPDIQSEIIGRVTAGCIVYVHDNRGNWLSVSYGEGDKAGYGFLHRSRVERVDDLKAIPLKSEAEHRIVFESATIRIEIESEKFDAKKLPVTLIRFPGGGECVTEINYEPIWGTDGTLPGTRYKGISVTQNKKKLEIPAEATAGLFEPRLSHPSTSAFSDEETGTIFITAFNSDGAGAYGCALRIVGGKFQDRAIFPGS